MLRQTLNVAVAAIRPPAYQVRVEFVSQCVSDHHTPELMTMNPSRSSGTQDSR